MPYLRHCQNNTNIFNNNYLIYENYFNGSVSKQKESNKNPCKVWNSFRFHLEITILYRTQTF